MKMLNRAGKCASFYFRQGYSIASLPFVFLGYAISIYYLEIENIPFIHNIFPRFCIFLIVASSTFPIFYGLIGYVYMKRSWLFREVFEIQIKANSYTSNKVAPISIPIYKILFDIVKKEGLNDIANEINIIINNSEKYRG